MISVLAVLATVLGPVSVATASPAPGKLWSPPNTPLPKTASIKAVPVAHGTGVKPQSSVKSAPPAPVAPIAAGSGSVDLAGTKSDAPKKAGSLPVWLAPSSAPGPLKPADSGSVTVTQADAKAIQASGATGLLLKIEPTTTAPAGGRAQVSLDVAALDAATRGDFSNRGQLVTLPACALTTPGAPECRTKTPLATHYDAATHHIVADVTLPAAAPAAGSADASRALTAAPAQAAAAPLLIAAADTSSGAGGSYKATSLNPSSQWAAGGSSGGMTYSYPIQMPPALGGAAPSVSLAYDSSSVDGETSASNSQASWIGDGWNYSPGFIERSYKPCSEDGITNSGDLCWGGFNATLSLGAHSGPLVRDDATGAWRVQGDDGTKVEFETDVANSIDTLNNTIGVANNTDNHEYVKVTDTSGTIYYFGLGHLPDAGHTGNASNSVSTVPVYSPNPGDPCYDSGKGQGSSCVMASRWALDYVVDPHHNLTTYTYAPETNWYSQGGGQNNGSGAFVSYTRANPIHEIDYGQNLDAQIAAGASPLQSAARVVFTTADRSDSGTWYDVPTDQECSASPCSSVSPTFFTTQKLTTITTGVRSNNVWQDVDSYALSQSFPPVNVSTDTSQRTLWLNSIQRTGKTGSPNVALPLVTFTFEMLPNRVDGIVSSSNGATFPQFYRPRMSSITNETGATTTVDWDGDLPGCSRVKNIMPSESSDSMSCFPVKWSPPGALPTDPPVLDWFNHYTVNKLTTVDPVDGGDSKQQVTAYTYSNPAWHHDDSALTDDKNRTWGEFRGYAHVKTVTGNGADFPAGQTTTTYLQGMDPGNGTVEVADDLGEWVIDDDWLAGDVLQTETFDQAGSSTVTSQTVNRLTGPVPTATQSRGALPALVARYSATTSTTTTRALKADSTPGHPDWRTTKTTTTTDPANNNRPITSLSQADGLSDLCTRTFYATGADAHTTDLADETMVVSGTGACTATPTAVNTVSDARVLYDNLGFGQAGTIGDPSSTQKLSSYDGSGTAQYITTGTSVFDGYGRPTSVTDPNSTDTQHPAGATTTTTYAPAQAGELPATVTTHAPVPGASTGTWDSITAFDVRRGLTLSVTDPNKKTTSEAYDALGRITSVWAPGRTTSQNANQTFTYTLDINRATPAAVTTNTLKGDSPSGNSPTYTTSIQIMDGYGRPRQTQYTAAYSGLTGRTISDTFYDTQGRAYLTYAPWYNADAPPSGTLVAPAVNPKDGTNQVPSATRLAFDGQGRQTASTFVSLGIDQSTTTTAYPGVDRTDVTPPSGAWPTTTVTDARGHTSQLWQYKTPTPTGNPGDATVTTYTYTPDGKPSSRVDAANNTWSYGYDLLGRQVKATDPDTGITLSTYDNDGRLTSTTDARNSTLAYSYDLLGRKTGEYTGNLNGTQLAGWSFDSVPNGLGHPASSTRYATGGSYTTSVQSYDDAYRAVSSTVTIPGSEVGQGTAFSYNTVSNYDQFTGNLDNATLPANGGLPAETMLYAHDLYGLMTDYKSTMGTYDLNTDYDPYGRPIRTAANPFATQVVSTTDYDQGTGQVHTQYVDKQSATKGQTQITGYTYNPAGQVTSVSDIPNNTPSATDRQCFTYDTLGRLTTAWTDTGTVTSPDPSLHRVLSQGSCSNSTPTSGATAPNTNTVGGPNPYWQDYSYDATGNRTGLTSHNTTGAPTLDPSQVSQVSTASDGTQTWGVTVANGAVWTASQNADGSWASFSNLMTQAGPLAAVTSVSAAVSNGQVQVMAIAGGKLWHTIRHSDGTWQAWGDVFAAVGSSLPSPNQLSLTATASGLEVLTTSGGKLWHTIRHSDGTWQTIGWGDVFANVGTLTSTDQIAAAATPSGLELMVGSGGKLWHTVRHPDGTWQSIGWGDVFGATGVLSGIATGPNQLALAGTTGGLEVMAIANGKPFNVLRNSSGSWSGWGDVTGAAGTLQPIYVLAAAASGADLKVLTVGSGQLNYTKRDGSTQGWTPWSVMNQGVSRDTVTTSNYPAPGTVNTPTTGGGTGGPHALLGTTSTSPNGTSYTTNQYDAIGNTTSTASSAGTTKLSWDAEDKLNQVVPPGTAGSTSYVYDADGNQLVRHDPGSTTVNIGSDELTYNTTTKTLTGTRYYPMPNGITAVRVGTNGLVYQIADPHGTNTLAIDATTLAETRRPTDPFGNPRGTQPTAGTWAGDKGFVGGTQDPATGLTNLGAREYDPIHGRFLNPDPLLNATDPQQWNGYAYSNNSPVDLSDPTGLCPPDICGVGTPIGGTGSSPSNPTRYVETGPEDPDNLDGGGVPAQPTVPHKKRSIFDSLSDFAQSSWSNAKAIFVQPKVWTGALETVAGGLMADAGYGAVAAGGVACVASVGVFCPEGALAMAGGFGLAGVGAAVAGKGLNDVVDGTEKGLEDAGSSGGASACSFSPDTPVLLAGGGSKSIGKIAPGDKVEAADPTTGKHQGTEAVTAIHINHDNDLVDLVVDTGGGHLNTLQTTSKHPFWDATKYAWVAAGDLPIGDRLQSLEDATVRVAAVKSTPGAANRYNLTVDTLHTYYVLAGSTPILVHNSNGCGITPRDGGGQDANGNVISGSESGQNLADQLRIESANSVFNEDGTLSQGAIRGAKKIIPGDEINNPNVRGYFDVNGGASQWGKYTTETYQSPYGPFQVHFYMNEETGEVFNYDYKVVMNRR
ncbi:polymorphic toxin-type HINT domain-containing protein [Kitasatospora sp. MAA4]|uniref:polymorphic toxin-type HINT domain-containing protein n=1 Tax=Kitasatospora sp. MAA4 TaxID=3035093 RepID=UPI002476F4CE|nr:polymorphic toxin-type HINT domain-containing protein [Kitasatospora sp. MAA4]